MTTHSLVGALFLSGVWWEDGWCGVAHMHWLELAKCHLHGTSPGGLPTIGGARQCWVVGWGGGVGWWGGVVGVVRPGLSGCESLSQNHSGVQCECACECVGARLFVRAPVLSVTLLMSCRVALSRIALHGMHCGP